MPHPNEVETYRQKDGHKKYHVKVVCPKCGKERYVDTWHYKTGLKKGTWTGYCRECHLGRRGKESHGYKGGRNRQTSGYIILLIPSEHWLSSMRDTKGYIYEHRYVMACKLGRPLISEEHVHHINGKRDDNRPENLMLIDATSHQLLTEMENRIKELEAENALLKQEVRGALSAGA